MSFKKGRIAAASIATALVGVPSSALAQVKPALMRDVDRPSAQPVTGSCFAFSAGFNLTKCVLYTVPAGKCSKPEVRASPEINRPQPAGSGTADTVSCVAVNPTAAS
jgi:hypothetical protein